MEISSHFQINQMGVGSSYAILLFRPRRKFSNTYPFVMCKFVPSEDDSSIKLDGHLWTFNILEKMIQVKKRNS